MDAPIDPLAFYNPETYLFPGLAVRFAETSALDPMELYLILDWKAPRARTKHLRRLAERASGSFERAAVEIATQIGKSANPKDRLRALLETWGFRLPTASAILSVLYPDEFTIYDVRVCDALRKYHDIADHGWPRVWVEYEQFLAAVRAADLPVSTLRDRDRWLWGEAKQKQMALELAAGGAP
jgi:hypothetical protein